MDFQINLPISPINFSAFFKSKSSSLSYAIDGTPPPGLTLNPVTGLMNGVPVTIGVFSDIRILATDVRQKYVLSNTFTMSVFAIDTRVITITVDNDVFQVQDVFEIKIKSYN